MTGDGEMEAFFILSLIHQFFRINNSSHISNVLGIESAAVNKTDTVSACMELID